MKRILSALALCSFIFAFSEAGAGTARLPRNPNKSHGFDLRDYVWSPHRKIKIRLAKRDQDSKGFVISELANTYDDGPWSQFCTIGIGCVSLDRARPVTLLAESITAALSGDGRGDFHKFRLGIVIHVSARDESPF